MNRVLSLSASDTERAGAELVHRLVAGDMVLLTGELGAGKTTLVRGMLRELGHLGPVRSPTFNLLQVFETEPPVLHADLYRVSSPAGLGLEDYWETHVNLIEWPDRLVHWVDPEQCWRVHIRVADAAREIEIVAPSHNG